MQNRKMDMDHTEDVEFEIEDCMNLVSAKFGSVMRILGYEALKLAHRLGSNKFLEYAIAPENEVFRRLEILFCRYATKVYCM
jgi:hypothetical protein